MERHPTGYVKLDTAKVADRMRRCRLSKSELAVKADVDSRTVGKVIAGERCQALNAYLIAKALGVLGHEDLMPDADQETASATMPSKRRTIGEWIIGERLTQWKPMPNGLQYSLWKMERSGVPGSFGRGKCYDLDGMPDDKHAETRERLMRHPAICDGIGRHPAIPMNKHAGLDGEDHFWVIDVWEEGSNLAEVLRQGPLELSILPTVMRQIAEGLQVLHENRIVRRELSPDFVTLRADDQSVLLTDLELAGILDGSPPTPVNWKENPYAAPELLGGHGDVKNDLFSWGQVLYHAATGNAPPKVTGPGLFDTVELPDFVKDLLQKSLRGRE